MTEILIKNPNAPFIFDNDDEVRKLLLELGLAGRFSQKPEGAPRTDQVVIYTQHPTHHIAVILFLGSTQPEDNGYLGICWPKSHASMAEFRARVGQIIRASPERVLCARSFAGPDDN